jgi:hypothetical protein
MPLVLTTKAQKLMKLCAVEGYANPLDLVQAVICDSVSPAICMTEGATIPQRWNPTKLRVTARRAVETRWSPR